MQSVLHIFLPPMAGAANTLSSVDSSSCDSQPKEYHLCPAMRSKSHGKKTGTRMFCLLHMLLVGWPHTERQTPFIAYAQNHPQKPLRPLNPKATGLGLRSSVPSEGVGLLFAGYHNSVSRWGCYQQFSSCPIPPYVMHFLLVLCSVRI